MAAGIVVRMRGSITVQAKPGGSNCQSALPTGSNCLPVLPAYSPNMASINSRASKGWRSSICSPTPI